jgi:hypothetical protein
MSGGFPFAPEFISANSAGTPVRMPENALFFTSEINRAARAVNEANMAIYPVDVRGLQAPDMRTVSAGSKLPPLPVPDAMLRLAGASGGRAFYFTNDLKGAVAEAVADGEVTYTIGFYPPENVFDGRFHELKVDVARKGVNVRHRSGYVAADARALTESQRRAILTTLVRNSLNASQIELAASAEGRSSVKISIAAADVRLEQQNNRRIGFLAIGLRLESHEKSTEKFSTVRVDISEDQYRTALKSGLTVEEQIPNAQSGDRLRIVVQDEATGLAGSLWLPFS